MKRGKPLRRTGRLQRRTRLSSGSTELRRTPLAPVGQRGRRHEARMRKLRPVVFRRDGYRCAAIVAPLCTGRAEHAHHLWPTEAGGPDDVENLLSVCSRCHDWIHNREPAAARKLGLLRTTL